MHQIRPGFLHMIARNRNRIELGHIGRGIFDNIRDNAHRRLGRINIGVAHHKFFENIVLNSARKHLAIMALLFTCYDEIGQNRDHRTVHRHRDGYFIKRDSFKKDFHILNAVNRNAGFAHIAYNARVIAVIAAMRGQIKRHGNALLPRSQGFAIKCIGGFRCGKSRILADCPRASSIHRGLNASGKGFLPWQPL